MPGASDVEASGISGNKIVGTYQDGSGGVHGFLYSFAVPVSKITLSGTMVTVSFNSSPGNTYRIEASTDLVHWSTIVTVTVDSSGKGTYSERMSGSMRYYRVSD
jgi:hypothetical protein